MDFIAASAFTQNWTPIVVFAIQSFWTPDHAFCRYTHITIYSRPRLSPCANFQMCCFLKWAFPKMMLWFGKKTINGEQGPYGIWRVLPVHVCVCVCESGTRPSTSLNVSSFVLVGVPSIHLCMCIYIYICIHMYVCVVTGSMDTSDMYRAFVLFRHF